MINTRISDKIAGAIRHFLYHKYTLTKYVNVLDGSGNPVIDDDGQPSYELGTPVTGKICLFLWKDTNVINEGAETIEKTPTLLVSASDDIEVGDIVSNVLSRNDIVLLTSAKVEVINTTSDVGSPTVKICILSGAQTP